MPLKCYGPDKPNRRATAAADPAESADRPGNREVLRLSSLMAYRGVRAPVGSERRIWPPAQRFQRLA
jgi:hypothetical protein